VNRRPYLGEERADLLEGLKQTGVADLLDDEDALWWLVPRQPLAGGVLNVPEHTKHETALMRGEDGLENYPPPHTHTHIASAKA